MLRTTGKKQTNDFNTIIVEKMSVLPVNYTDIYQIINNKPFIAIKFINTNILLANNNNLLLYHNR